MLNSVRGYGSDLRMRTFVAVSGWDLKRHKSKYSEFRRHQVVAALLLTTPD